MLKNQRTVGKNKTDREKTDVLINLMTRLKERDRKCIYHLALALAKQRQLIWSFEDIYDKGYIVEKPSESEIPNGRWIGFVWFYPQYQKVFTELNKEEIREIRRQRNRIKEKLQQELIKISKSTIE